MQRLQVLYTGKSFRKGSKESSLCWKYEWQARWACDNVDGLHTSISSIPLSTTRKTHWRKLQGLFLQVWLLLLLLRWDIHLAPYFTQTRNTTSVTMSLRGYLMSYKVLVAWLSYWTKRNLSSILFDPFELNSLVKGFLWGISFRLHMVEQIENSDWRRSHWTRCLTSSIARAAQSGWVGSANNSWTCKAPSKKLSLTSTNFLQIQKEKSQASDPTSPWVSGSIQMCNLAFRWTILKAIFPLRGIYRSASV